MFKIFKDQFQIRSLIILFLLLSNIHPNPGPINSIAGTYNSSTPSLTLANDEYAVSIVVTNSSGDNAWTIAFSSSLGSNSINVRLTGTDKVEFNNIYCGALSGTFNVFITQTLGSAGARFNILFSPLYRPPFTGVKVLNTISEKIPTSPQLTSTVNVAVTNTHVPVEIVNPAPVSVEVTNDPLQVAVVLPTQLPVIIENEDPISVTFPVTNPIPITGTVSISNPLPSVATTFLNAFKK